VRCLRPLGEPCIDTVKRRAQHAFQVGALREAAPEQFIGDESLHRIVRFEESVRGGGAITPSWYAYGSLPSCQRSRKRKNSAATWPWRSDRHGVQNIHAKWAR